MSIPPLVCSTPPPLEQCEDDKDTEEFDLQYNLSPYDDDEANNDYNYGSFNSFHSIQPTEKPANIVFSNPIQDVNNISDNVKSKEIVTDVETATVESSNQLQNEEEVTIEDLNLKLDQEEPPHIKSDPEEIIEGKCDVDNKINNDITIIPGSSHHNDLNNCTENIPITEDVDKHFSEKDIEKSITTNGEAVSNENSKDSIDHNQQKDVESVTVSAKRTSEDFEIQQTVEKDEDDDFDDFQFISSDIKPINTADIFVTQESPWGDEESTYSDFGKFTANFEDSAGQTLPEKINDDSKEGITVVEDDDDDFGDFDDFKSSTAEVKNDNTSEELSPQVPVFNLSSVENENQLMENINKVLSSIFKEEAKESEDILEAKLDSVLNETWGHLMETDVRQPYIVNWNNSLAQKTLLKSLCIDSRNILFGPKWNYNMPKYAANLTTAPLQPQKQTSTSSTQSETTNPDKSASKSATWSDPFATNGQESCSSEGENTVIEPRPTDLDVFEAAISSKKDKIYSSTISVQPIRQINLPDTHIFTPTDSETPRSKTIHYDCSPVPNVLMPQPVMDSFKTEDNKPNIPNTDDNEYWEFQDFKGAVENNQQSVEKKDLSNNDNVSFTNFTKPLDAVFQSIDSNNANITSSGVSISNSSILQPTLAGNLEMPTTSGVTILNQQKSDQTLQSLPLEGNSHINWPNPGTDLQDLSTFSAVETSKLNVLIPKPAMGSLNINDNKSIIPSKTDNEYWEFQDFKGTPVENNWQPLEKKDLDNYGNVKSDDISFTHFTKPSDAVFQSVESTKPKLPSSSGISLANSGILQPTPTGPVGQVLTNSGTIQSQQKSGQILQPLSLESYSHINWPDPGIDLQDLSRFNPVETLPSLKSETSGNSKVSTPIHNQKTVVNSQTSDEDIWGEFVSSNPKPTPSLPKKTPALIDDDEWTDFVSSSSVKPQNGLNTISFNVHTNSNIQKSSNQNKLIKNNQIPLDIPSLNYITPKTSSQKTYNDKHFQNL